jgi:hypothetical protein
LIRRSTADRSSRIAGTERELESKESEFGWLRGGNRRDLRLYAPIELFTRRSLRGVPDRG